MAYICKDCSYRGVTSGQLGECPACGSYNMERRLIIEKDEPPPRWRLQLLIVLWGVLIIMIVGKLIF